MGQYRRPAAERAQIEIGVFGARARFAKNDQWVRHNASDPYNLTIDLVDIAAQTANADASDPAERNKRAAS